jgi:hypothetical protein
MFFFVETILYNKHYLKIFIKLYLLLIYAKKIKILKRN